MIQNSNSPTKISAVIITFNEERNIGRCIDSLQGVADEIVVVDSFSTDKTYNICQQKKVVTVQKKWKGYSAAKNFGNEIAKNDFILSIDADEVINDILKESILKMKIHSEFSAYNINRITNYCGQWIKYCGWYPDVKLRLWDKKIGSWQGGIHERISLNNATRTGHLKGDILHFAINNIQDHIKRSIIFSDIAAKEAFENGEKVSIFFHIILNPLFTFFRQYFLKLGFLDGYYGFVICVLSAFSNFLKYTKLMELNRKHVQ